MSFTDTPTQNNVPEYASIVSDAGLEQFAQEGYDYYLVAPDNPVFKDITITVRKAPHVDGLSDWSADGFTTEEIVTPFGVGIVVTDIVPSATGIWVGFIRQASVLPDIPLSEIPFSELFASQSVYYTKIENVRAKAGALSPSLSTKILAVDDKIKPYVPPGARDISPKDNQNWLTLEPNDVRLIYYNFTEHNQKVVGGIDTPGGLYLDRIAENPTLGISEGYYYFIIGQNRRENRDEITGQVYGEYKSSEEKQALIQDAAAVSIQAAKENAFANLLDYLGKDRSSQQAAALENYFVLVDLKVNTKTANPDNQKTLFAIRAEYADALPDRTEPYQQRFDLATEASFSTGRDFSVNLKLKNIQRITDNLIEQLTKIKSKIDLSKLKITDASGVEFDIDLQIQALESFPQMLNDFLARQGFPAHTNQDSITNLALDGIDTPFDHLIQLGMKDNGEIGFNVRETISHILFSPDPQSLIGTDSEGKENSLGLFNFDPYISEDELADSSNVKRSAVNLSIALPYFRDKFSGAYGSRALHYFLSYSSIYKYFVDSGAAESVYDWAEFLQKYSVPPLKIYPSQEPAAAPQVSKIDCDEIIERLNQSSPNVGPEEKRLQELLYNSPECKEAYFKQFSKATPAVDGNLRRLNLDNIVNNISKGKKTSSKTSAQVIAYINLIYRQFFAVLDPDSLISLIIACLQKKLGLELSIEAICEAAVKELVQRTGVEAIIGLAIANAILAPDKQSSRDVLAALANYDPSLDVIKTNSELILEITGKESLNNATSGITMDDRFVNAPLATAMAMSKIDFDEMYAQTGITTSIIETLRKLEKAGVEIKFTTAKRGPFTIGDVFTKVGTEDQYFGNLQNGGVILEAPATDRFTLKELNSERTRLKNLGYSDYEVDILLVQQNYQIPDPYQWLMYVKVKNTPETVAAFLIEHGIDLEDPRWGSLSGDFKDMIPFSTNNVTPEYDPARNNSQDRLTTEDFLDYINRTVGTTALCELILTELLEGLEDLLKDPFGGFGSIGNNFRNFSDQLIKKLKAFMFSLRIPDDLKIKSTIDGFGKKILEALLIAAATIAAQIAKLYIKEALDKCLEENNDQGPSNNPVLPDAESVSIPEIQLAGIPPVAGVPEANVAEWIKDLIDRITNSQLCALLRGDATRATLLDLLARTQFDWTEIYQAGIDTAAEISAVFKTLGENLSLDICEFITPSSPIISDICESVYDRDARCAELLGAGLTEEECQKQIDRELEDMRNKVVDLAGFSLGGSGMLSYALPNVCGEDGFFELPPGIRYAMDSITGNMLETVKGSILTDLNTLKFFTIPPPAVMSLTDTAKLSQIHGLYRRATRKPVIRTCFAYIGNPYDGSGFRRPVRTKSYPITYNRYSHYGGYVTKDRNKDGAPYAKPAQYATENFQRQEALSAYNTKEVFKDIVEDVKDTFLVNNSDSQHIEELDWFDPMHLGMFFDDELTREQLARSSTVQRAMREFFLDQRGLSPGTVIKRTYIDVYAPQQLETAEPREYKEAKEPLVGFFWSGVIDPYNYGGIPVLVPLEGTNFDKINFVNERPYIVELAVNEPIAGAYHVQPGETVNLKKILDSGGATIYKKGDLVPYIKHLSDEDTLLETTDYNSVVAQYGDNSSDITEKITNVLTNEEVPIPSYMKDIVIDQKQLMKVNRALGTLALKGPRTGDLIAKTSQSYLRRSYSLDTKLRDINANGCRWYTLMSYFVGFDMRNKKNYRTWPGTDDEDDILIQKEDESAFKYMLDNFTLSDSPFPVALTDGIDPGASYGLIDEDGDGEADYLGEVETSYDKSDGYYSYYAKNSPGFIRLLEILEEQAGYESVECKIRHSPGKRRIHHFVSAFMELTVREALGLEDDRVGTMLPNFRDMSSASGIIFTEGPGVLDVDTPEGKRIAIGGGIANGNIGLPAPINTDDYDGEIIDLSKDDAGNSFGARARLYEYNQILPLYITFRRVFAPDDHPLNQSAQELYDFFSGENDPVNKRLLDTLKSETEFDQVIGFNNSIEGMTSQSDLRKQNINRPNFNADMLKFNMPFKKASINSVGSGAGIDFGTLQDMFNETVNIEPDGGLPAEFLNFQNLVQETSKQNDLIYQNVGLPIQKNINLQLDGPRNISKFANCVLDQKFDIDPGIMTNDRVISKTKFNFEFAKKLDDDVSDLVQQLYSSSPNVPFSQKVLEEYQFLDFEGTQGAYTYSPFNFKAQVFGKMLSKKLDQYINDYKPEDSNGLTTNQKYLFQFLLSDYGYPSLQKAYVNQSFSRLKDSRLQYRKYMRKLWDKILRVEGFNKNKPECIDPLTQTSALSNEELQNTETDFFNIGSTKERIIDFYAKSVCLDVYEKSSPEDNAARVALLQGSLILLIKVFTLEVCLSGLIGWDSYDIEDVISSEAIINLIIHNIRKELPDGISINFISDMAADIIKKEEGLTEMEFAVVREKQSGLEYMIKKEAKGIEAAIQGDKTVSAGNNRNDGIFVNRNPLTTDLVMDILKISDESFKEEFPKKINLDLQDDDPNQLYSFSALGLPEPQEVFKVPTVPTDAQLLQELIDDPNEPTFVEGTKLIELPEKVDFPKYPVEEAGPLFTAIPGWGSQPTQYFITQANKQPSLQQKPLKIPSADTEYISSAHQTVINEKAFLKNYEEHLDETIQPKVDKIVNKGESYATALEDPEIKQLIRIKQAMPLLFKKLQDKQDFYAEYALGSETYKDFHLRYNLAILGNSTYEQKKQKYDDQQKKISTKRRTYSDQIKYIVEENTKILNNNAKLVEQLNEKLDERKNPQVYRDLVEQTGFDYAVDARFSSNIYSMNYGFGYKEKSIFGVADQGFMQTAEPFTEQNLFDQKTIKDVEDVLSKNNRNFFHSLPLRGRYLHGYNALFEGLGQPGYFDFTKSKFEKDYEEFSNITALQRDLLGMAHSFTKENFVETTFGSKQNAKLGNVIFQPYVRIVDTTADERQDMTVDVVKEKAFDDNGEPCDPTYEKRTFSASDYEDFFSNIDEKRNFNMNIFYSEIRDYIPISVWSYFYNEIFIKEILSFNDTVKVGDEEVNPILELYKKYGFTLMFMQYKYGIRMSYTIPLDVLSGEDHDLTKIIDDIFDNSSEGNEGCRLSKSIINQRPYTFHGNTIDGRDAQEEVLLNEINIPIVEVEKSLDVNINENSFSFESNIYDLDSLGFWSEKTLSSQNLDVLGLTLEDSDILKHLINNPHQFFYQNAASSLVNDLKNSAEFKLMYDYLFPMKNYMSLAFVYAGEGLTKFIPEPTDILEQTKINLFEMFTTLINSNDYTFLPDPVANRLEDKLISLQTGTARKEKDMSKEIEKLILETMYLTLKNLVEQTDPAVNLAQRIIDAANAIATAALDAVEAGNQTAKAALEGARTTQEQIVRSAETALSIAGSIATTVVNVAKAGALSVPTDPGDPNSPTIGSLIIFEADDEDFKKWKFEIDPSIQPQKDSSVEEYEYDTKKPLYVPSSLDIGGTYEYSGQPGQYYEPQTDLEASPTPGSDFKVLNEQTGETNTYTAGVLTVGELVNLGVFREVQPGEKIKWVRASQIGGEIFLNASEEVQKAIIEIDEVFNNSISDETPGLKALLRTLIGADEKLSEILSDIENVIEEIEEFHRKAKNTIQKIFKSPFLLPGLWFLMFPTWIPYGGGFPPPNPLFITGFGPPSTVPGMIYIALLIIDAIDEKTHDDINQEEDPCLDEL